MRKTRRLPLTNRLYMCFEFCNSKQVSHLLQQTAHFFLSIIYRTSDIVPTTAPTTVQTARKNAEVTMYQSSLQEKFPARAIHLP